MPSIVFDYGSFNYQSRIHSKPNSADAAIISGSFELQGRDVPAMLKGIFDLYDLFVESPVGASQDRVMLGPYLPWYVCQDNGMNFPRFSSLILNSKSSKVRPFNQSLIEEKVQILANFFAHYLLLANFDLNYDLILPVPAKPRYAINTLNFACSEFSKVARIPSDFSVLSRISDEEKTYQLNPQSGNIIVGKRIILFDDISTSGTTENLIREILQNGGASGILLIAFGNTDHSDYCA